MGQVWRLIRKRVGRVVLSMLQKIKIVCFFFLMKKCLIDNGCWGMQGEAHTGKSTTNV